LLESTGRSSGEVETEFGFKPQLNEYLIADVVLVSRSRWESIAPDGYMEGAPDFYGGSSLAVQ
jgi:hypothetical protein